MRILAYSRLIFRETKRATGVDEMAARILLIVYFATLPLTLGQIKEKMDASVQRGNDNPIPGELDKLLESGHLESYQAHKTKIFTTTPKGLEVIAVINQYFQKYSL